MMSLESELKKEMGYSEEKRECQGYCFSERKENPMLDRDWYHVCNYNRIAAFQIKQVAHCNKWEPK